MELLLLIGVSMHCPTLLFQLYHTLFLPYWQNTLEIIFCIYCSYYALYYTMPYWYTRSFYYLLSYVIILLVAYYTELHTIFFITIHASPYLLLLHMLYHQKTIQRMVLTPKNITHGNTKAHLPTIREYIISWALKKLNQQKELYMIIEQANPIYYECMANIDTLNTPLSPAIIEILLHSNAVSSQKMILLTSSGTIHGYNGVWKHQELSTMSHEQWIEDTCLYLSQTDAIALYAEPKSRLFTVVTQDTVIQQIDSNQLTILLDQLLQSTIPSSSNIMQKGVHHAQSLTKKNSHKFTH